MRLNGEPAQGSARQLQTRSCLFVFEKMWEIHGLTFWELKQAVKRLRMKLSVIKKKKKHGKEQTESVESVPRGLFGGMFGCS